MASEIDELLEKVLAEQKAEAELPEDTVMFPFADRTAAISEAPEPVPSPEGTELEQPDTTPPEGPGPLSEPHEDQTSPIGPDPSPTPQEPSQELPEFVVPEQAESEPPPEATEANTEATEATVQQEETPAATESPEFAIPEELQRGPETEMGPAPEEADGEEMPDLRQEPPGLAEFTNAIHEAAQRTSEELGEQISQRMAEMQGYLSQDIEQTVIDIEADLDRRHTL